VVARRRRAGKVKETVGHGFRHTTRSESGRLGLIPAASLLSSRVRVPTG
jgi:hypothetical protein